MTPRTSALLLLALLAACSDANQRAVTVEQTPAPETTAVDTTPPAPPPLPPLRVSPKQVAFDALNDTARLTVPEGAECRSAAPGVALIEDGSLLRSTGNGVTHVRCWREGRVATVSVRVAQRLANVVIVAEQGFSIRRNGDSLQLAYSPTDRLGRVVNAPATWQSMAPQVVAINSAGVAVGLADSGRARVIAQVGDLADTVTLEIGAKTSAAQLLSASSRSASRARLLARANRGLNRGTQVAGPGGILNQSLATGAGGQLQQQNPQLGIAARQPSTSDSLFQNPGTGGFGRSRFLVPFVAARLAEHRVSDASGLGKTSGLLIGAGADILTRGVLSFKFQFLAGTATAEDALATDRQVLDGSFDIGFALSPWLTVIGGAGARRYEDIATERWLSLRAGGEANFSLGGGPLRGIARILVMPLVSIAGSVGTVESPSFGMASALGLGFESRRVSTSLLYEIERYDFPSTAGRDEQFGALLFRFGYKVGW